MKNNGFAGFSLIEVNMAILVVAGGLLTLFSLFPASLRLSVTALSDTRQAMFAEDILSKIRGNAALITSYDVWNDANLFWDAVATDYPLSEISISKNTPTDAENEDSDHFGVDTDLYYADGEISRYFVDDGEGSPTSIPVKYCIRLVRGNHPTTGRQSGTGNSTWRISLVCTDQPDAWFYDNSVYYTEVNPSF